MHFPESRDNFEFSAERLSENAKTISLSTALLEWMTPPTKNMEIVKIGTLNISHSRDHKKGARKGWEHCLLDRGSDIVNSEPKHVVRNEPRGVCRF